MTPTDAVRAVFATISDGRYEDLSRYMGEDFVFELPYGPAFLPRRFDGLATWNEMQGAMFALFEQFTETLDTVYETRDPATVIAEYHSDAIVKGSGAAYRNEYIGVFRIRDGRIVFWREYHNPEAVAKALGG
jgi:ketosteroid isomerase-like protein